MAACRGGARTADRLISRRAFVAAAFASLPGCAVASNRVGLGQALPLPALPPGAAMRSLGGYVINTGVLGFGGLSGLHLADDLTLTALSDRARFAHMRLGLDSDLRPTGLDLIEAGRLGDETGKPLSPGIRGDSEALARLPDGTWLVGFERMHRIRAYQRLDGPGASVAAPPGIERSPPNASLESLAVLADGRWLVISEGLQAPSHPEARAAWIGRPSHWRRIAYRPAPGMSPVDAAGLPEGGVLVLERSFSLFGGFDGRLVHVSAQQVAEAGGRSVLSGHEILRIAPPLPIDNYEGVAVLERDGRTLVALVSDDNESLLQRSLLLLFEMGH